MTFPLLRAPMRALMRIAALSFALSCASPVHAAEPGAPPRAATREAEELAALPNGGWLALEKRALRLLDATGAERARLALRAEKMDLRPTPRGAMAVLLDSDSQRVLRVDVDLAAMALAIAPVLDSPPYTVEALCLYRDAQGLDHLFVIGDEGLAEQWLLRDGAPPLSQRRLALPPGSGACRADDAAGLLYVNETGFGVWAYGADAEGPLVRHAVALRRPWGALEGGSAAFAVLPGGLAVLDGSGRELHLIERRAANRWSGVRRLAMGARGEVEQFVVRSDTKQAQLAWRDEARPGWRSRSLRWTRRADVGLPPALPVVQPRVQTDPVSRFGDAADDPAIWVHPTDPALSRVLGTNKRQGLHVYGLDGREQQLLELGRLNNVDLRQRVRLGGQERDLAVATQRDDFSLVMLSIDAEGRVAELGRVPTGLDDIYGVCLHVPRTGGLEVFVNDKSGRILRIALDEADGRIAGRVVQRFAVATQPEGCVADDAAERLFIGEEDRGVWAMDIAPSAGLGDKPPMQMVLPVGPHLRDDVEGLALYNDAEGNYLVISSQGNHSYVVVDAAAPYRLRGAFRIGISPQQGIDGVSETDGLEATSKPLGPSFPRGMLVVQDGFKRMPGAAQNFKYVAWEDVARALGLP